MNNKRESLGKKNIFFQHFSKFSFHKIERKAKTKAKEYCKARAADERFLRSAHERTPEGRKHVRNLVKVNCKPQAPKDIEKSPKKESTEGGSSRNETKVCYHEYPHLSFSTIKRS